MLCQIEISDTIDQILKQVQNDGSRGQTRVTISRRPSAHP
jgi:hypothetical protein